MVFVPVPGTELLKPLEFPVQRVIEVSFVMLNKVIFGKPLRMPVEPTQ